MGLDYEYYDMIDSGFGVSSSSTTWMIVAFILAVVGGILTYFSVSYTHLRAHETL